MRSSKPHGTLADDGLDLEGELKIHLDTLHELGPEYSDSLATAFVERVDRLIEERVEQRLAERGGSRTASGPGARRRAVQERRRLFGPWVVIPILAMGIPLTAVAGGIAALTIAAIIAAIMGSSLTAVSIGIAGTLGVAVVWTAILIIGLSWIASRRRAY